MKILVFSNSEWDNTNSLGNTLSNFFEGEIWKNDEFYNIYMRNSLPNNNVCQNYYRMSLIDMIKHYFNKENIGYEFIYTNDYNTNNINRSEKRIINFIHKFSIKWIYSFADYIYNKKKWINNKFINYIKSIDPDIFFSFLSDVSMLDPMIEFMKNNTNAKIILFIADDVYGSYKTNKNRKMLESKFKNIISNADRVYTISDEMAIEYNKLFHKPMFILRKGCSFDFKVKSKVNNPIRFVYAGNLLYGRIDTLSKIAMAIDENNKLNDKKAILEIFTPAIISDDIRAKLEIDGSSIIKGKRSYSEIKKIMNDADYNLHVESFDDEQINLVRYSFSTKIIDCLQSGSSIFAIGPEKISSIKYIKKIPGSIVCEDLNKIESIIFELINNNCIIKNSKLIRKFAIENHLIKNIQSNLKNDFFHLIEDRGD